MRKMEKKRIKMLRKTAIDAKSYVINWLMDCFTFPLCFFRKKMLYTNYGQLFMAFLHIKLTVNFNQLLKIEHNHLFRYKWFPQKVFFCTQHLKKDIIFKICIWSRYFYIWLMRTQSYMKCVVHSFEGSHGSFKKWIGGFQLEFVSVISVISPMTCYEFSALIGWNYSIQTGEQIL